MNTIELKGELHTSETDDNLYFVVAIFVDGEAVEDFHYYATSLDELKQSVSKNGDYFILTCWCGEPSCAGISKGVQVVRNANYVEWTIHQPKPQRIFTFDAASYERAIISGIEQIRHDVANLWFTVSGEKDEKLEIVPGMEEDMALLEPKARTKEKARHRNA